MISKLSPEQFHKRLTELTVFDQTISFFSRHEFSGKPFNGTFTNDTFELTKNSHWQHIKGILIKGTYKVNSNNKTEIELKIETSNKLKIFIRILFILVLLIINTLLMNSNFDSSKFFILNGWVIFMFLFGATTTKFSKFLVNQKFKNEFGVDMNPTGLNGYSENETETDSYSIHQSIFVTDCGDQLQEMTRLQVDLLQPLWGKNLGGNQFNINTQPIEAQFGPIMGMELMGLDDDGQEEIILVGNI
ncbi:MAG: hypothetical protein OCD76_20000 [Reichenbachiella sp.]